jgi:nucleotide-binding universal stress UspA family protein
MAFASCSGPGDRSSPQPDDAARAARRTVGATPSQESIVSERILVGYSPESLDRAPVDFAAAAARLTGAALTVAVVHPGGSHMDRLSGGEFGHDATPEGRDTGEQLVEELRAGGVDAAVHPVEHSTPARGLAAAIEAVQPSLVVLGSGEGGRMGGTAERVVHGAPCAVAVVPRGYTPGDGPRVIGAAYAPSAEGGEALRAAARLAAVAGGRVRAVMALSPKHAAEQSPGLMAGAHHDRDASEDIDARHRLDAQGALAAAIAEHAGGVEVETDILYQAPAHALVAASQNLDLLVMGSRAYGPVRSVLLGGVSHRVMADAACPVIVLPRGAERGLDQILSAADPAPAER